MLLCHSIIEGDSRTANKYKILADAIRLRTTLKALPGEFKMDIPDEVSMQRLNYDIQLIGKYPKFYWVLIRECIFERDLYTCQRCGRNKNELDHTRLYKYDLKNSLTCHHIIPLKDGGTNQFTNLITLCGRCHNKIHFNNETL